MVRKPAKAAAANEATLITGANSGIGLALTRRLLAEGRTVYAATRSLARARDALGADSKHANLRLIQLDVTKPAHAKKALAKIRANGDRIVALVNNAGYGAYGPFEEMSERMVRDQHETNFHGPMHLCRAFLPEMRSNGGGYIYNVSSILGQLVLPTGVAYTSSKWALEAFSEALRYEVFPFGIHVVSIEPGLVVTSFKDNVRKPKNYTKENSPYRFLNRLLDSNGYNRFTTTSEQAADRIASIMAKRRPAARYRVGLDSHLYYTLKCIMPAFAIDWVFKSNVRRLLRQAN